MSKFVTVKEAPPELKKGEFVIEKPNFLPEVAQQRSKQPKNGLTARFHLRLLVDTIAQNYDPENMTGWVIKSHLFEGRPFHSDEDMNQIVVEALQGAYPQIFDRYLEQKVKTRPAGTETIYLVDFPLYSEPEAILYRYGLSEQEEQEDETKPRRIVGKPAITKEQAELLKKQ